jgi:hypothetical protein
MKALAIAIILVLLGFVQARWKGGKE